MAHKVFVSYSSRDKKAVMGTICPTLEAAGVGCWVAPRDIAPGITWAEAITEAIDDCRAFVVVLSQASSNSADVFREVVLAAAKVPILTFRIQDVQPSRRLEYYLRPTQWIDAFVPPFRARVGELTETVLGLMKEIDPKWAPSLPFKPPTDQPIGRIPREPLRQKEGRDRPARRSWLRRGRLALIALLFSAAAAAVVVTLLLTSPGGTESSTTTTEFAESTVAAGGATSTTTSIQVKENWKFKTGGKVPSTPAIADGMVYFWSTEGYLFAVDTATGEERWRHEAARGPWGYANGYSPALAEGMVYVNAHDGIAKLDAKTGAEEGSFKTDEGFESASVSSSPVARDGVLYFGLMMADRPRSPMYAVNAKTMRKLWRFEPGGPMTYSPAVSGGVVYFRVGADICAVDVRGSEKWRFTTGSNAVSPPTISDAVVYFGSGEGYLHALDAETRQEKWRFETGGVITYSPTVSDGVVYVVSRDGCLYAVYTASGQEKWKFKPSASISCSPAVWGGVVYFGSWDNCLHAVEASSGQEKWRFNTDGATTFAPTVADGVVYFGSDDGYLYAVPIPPEGSA